MEKNAPSDDLNIGKYWRVLRRRWLPATTVFITVSVLSFFSTSLETPVYSARGSLLFRTSRAPSLTGLDQNLGELDSLTFASNPLETQAQIVQSVPVAQAVIRDLNLTNEEGEPLSPSALLNSLQVSIVSETTDVLLVTYRSEDPELAAAIVNGVMREYIDSNLLDNRAEAASAREFIESKLPESEAAVRDAEIALRQFKEDNQIVTLEEEADAIVEILKNLDQQILATQADLVDTASQSAELSEQLGMDSRQSLISTALGATPGIQDLLAEFQAVQNELAIERTRYRDNYPTIVRLERQEAALNALLQDRIAQGVGEAVSINPGQIRAGQLQQNVTETLVNLEIQQIGLAQQLEQLSTTRNTYQSRARVFPRLEEIQGLLERRLENAISNYQDLLVRLQEVQIAENQNLGNARIIQEALAPTSPVSNQSELIVFAGAVCGALLGIAVAFLLDLLDRSVKSVKDAQTLLKYPLLGVIPDNTRHEPSVKPSRNMGNHADVSVINDPFSLISKSYQILLANIKAVCGQKQGNVVVFASATEDEGTSVVTANLAATVAQSHQNVLLIDANFSNPSQHRIWGLHKTEGLSDVIDCHLKDTAFRWKDAVHQVQPQLSVMVAGKAVVNSLEAFSSPGMDALLFRIASDYDVVIIDTPPLIDSADAIFLSRLTQGLVLVVGHQKATVNNLEAVRDMLVRSHQRVFGFVANQVPDSSEVQSSLLQMPFLETSETSKALSSSIES